MSMPFYYSLPFLSIFLIMVGAILLSVISRPRFSWHVSFWTAVVTALLSAVFLLCVLRDDIAFSGIIAQRQPKSKLILLIPDPCR